MNILLLSVGTRNKIIRYFKDAVGEQGKVIATDMSELAPAVYEADVFYKVPRITADGYLDVIYDICRKERVNAVLTLIDPELSLLALHEKEFEALGVTIVGSSYELCERALDKMNMYEWLKDNRYNCAKSYISKEAFYNDVEKGNISYPVIVKPKCGSASISVTKAYDRETIEFLCRNSEDILIQEFLEGQEIGADVYIDMISREVVSIFTKKKISMRAGETEKSVSFKDERLFSLIEKFVKESGWLGQIDIDLFEVGGEYYISEVNPRFGGGYPHAYECGCNHMELIINNLRNIENVKNIGSYEEGIYMLKHNDVLIRRI